MLMKMFRGTLLAALICVPILLRRRPSCCAFPIFTATKSSSPTAVICGPRLQAGAPLRD